MPLAELSAIARPGAAATPAAALLVVVVVVVMLLLCCCCWEELCVSLMLLGGGAAYALAWQCGQSSAILFFDSQSLQPRTFRAAARVGLFCYLEE